MRESERGNDLPELYKIFYAEVASLQNYGAFIRLPRYKKQGLLHKSQMSTVRIEDPSEMLAKGEKVYVKVIAVEAESEKISLSMKVVNQTTGQDLDPNNVQASQDEKKRRQWNFKGKNKIELGAELNTTCRKCGGHGHFAIDCFVGKDGSQYDLIPDIETLTELPPLSERQAVSTGKKKKKKKEKKKKEKKKKKHQHSSSSDSDTDNSEEHNIERHHSSKDREKFHKRRHQSKDRDDVSGSSCDERAVSHKNTYGSKERIQRYDGEDRQEKHRRNSHSDERRISQNQRQGRHSDDVGSSRDRSGSHEARRKSGQWDRRSRSSHSRGKNIRERMKSSSESPDPRWRKSPGGTKISEKSGKRSYESSRNVEVGDHSKGRRNSGERRSHSPPWKNSQRSPDRLKHNERKKTLAFERMRKRKRSASSSSDSESNVKEEKQKGDYVHQHSSHRSKKKTFRRRSSSKSEEDTDTKSSSSDDDRKDRTKSKVPNHKSEKKQRGQRDLRKLSEESSDDERQSSKDSHGQKRRHSHGYKGRNR